MSVSIGVNVQGRHHQEKLSQVTNEGPCAEDLLSFAYDLCEDTWSAIVLEIVL